MKIEYHKEGDYYFPNLMIEEKPIVLSKYGRAKLRFMKKHQKALYTNLLTKGQLNNYLENVDKQANDLYDNLLVDFKEQWHVTEELKEKDQMLWVQEMNNIIACINEIIYEQCIYN